MTYVQFYYNYDWEAWVPRGRVILNPDNSIRFEDMKPKMVGILEAGVLDARGKLKTVADGILFLKALSSEYNGSYCRASKVLIDNE